jgi:flagellar biosynthesis protein FlhA
MAMAAVPPLAATSPWTKIQDLILPIGVIASVLVILAPVPAHLMDLLLAGNIAIAAIMLLTTLCVRTPLEFSVFPSLLLTTTLFRLVLNVATTRLILTRASGEGLLAAGGVVRSFGEFVTGGGTGADKVIVGLVIFSIIVLIQFVVITKGATRISEVAARFTLDGMPGKQMSIDADLSAGVIDQTEAQRRRREISQQADFFGAMDGASKFVRGDAIAGIVMIFINIIGGLVIGLAENGMSFSQAISLFTTLTIGDGLVTQVPALLISLAAGMLVTRSSEASDLSSDVVHQLFSRPLTLAVAGGFFLMLIFTSLPRVPLLLIGTACTVGSIVLFRKEAKTREVQTLKQDAAVRRANQRVEDYLAVDPMELELGVGLIRLADVRRGGDLLERIQRVRQLLASEMGVILPKVRVRDNMRLEPNQYRIKIADVPVAQGAITPDSLDPSNTIAVHLNDTVRFHADELLTRDAVKHLLDELRQTSPAVVDELVPNQMKLGEVQRVLQTLLREEVPIRQLGPILETLGDRISETKDPGILAEYIRQRLARVLCRRYCDMDNRLRVITLDPVLEDRIRTALEGDGVEDAARFSPRDVSEICRAIEVEMKKLTAVGRPPIVLVDPSIRSAVKRLTMTRLPQLVVLSYSEVTRDTRIESVAMAVGKLESRRLQPA